jgi:hypothetical protein
VLLEFFPAPVEAFGDLAAPDALGLLGGAPDPPRAARLTRAQVTAALRAARRHHADTRAAALLAALRAPGLRQPPVTEAAYAAVVTGQVRILTALNDQIAGLLEVMAEHLAGTRPLISTSASRVSGSS